MILIRIYQKIILENGRVRPVGGHEGEAVVEPGVALEAGAQQAPALELIIGGESQQLQRERVRPCARMRIYK